MLLENTFHYTLSCISSINLFFKNFKYRNSWHTEWWGKGKRDKRENPFPWTLKRLKSEKIWLSEKELVATAVVKLCREGPCGSRCCGAKSNKENTSFTKANFKSSSIS